MLDALARVNEELGAATAVIAHNAAIAAIGDRVLAIANGGVASELKNPQRASPAELSW